MSKQRMEAFSDGVIAILITVMVLGLRTPDGTDWPALRQRNQHHHMLQATHRVNGRILVANLHFLFWLSLVPFVTAWLRSGESLPAAAYGGVALFSGLAYLILQRAIIREHGADSKLAEAVGSDLKGMSSALLYALAIPMAFWDYRIAIGIYALLPLLWLVPDPRIESKLRAHADR